MLAEPLSIGVATVTKCYLKQPFINTKSYTMTQPSRYGARSGLDCMEMLMTSTLKKVRRIIFNVDMMCEFNMILCKQQAGLSACSVIITY